MQEVITALHITLAHLERARERLADGRREWAGAAQLYVDTLHDSTQAEPVAVRQIAKDLEQTMFPRLYVILFNAQAAIKKMLRLYGAAPRPRTPPAPPRQPPPGGRPASGEPPPTGPAAVTNRHGDRYPSEAAGLVENLPPRVVSGAGDRTVGVPRVGGRPAAPIESGYDPELSEAISARLAELGVRDTYLRFHTELKVAQMMVQTGHQEVELAINNVPCGIETQRNWADTCDKVLDRYLPAGSRLTVYGTTRDNRPWRRIYGSRR